MMEFALQNASARGRTAFPLLLQEEEGEMKGNGGCCSIWREMMTQRLEGNLRIVTQDACRIVSKKRV